MLECITEIIVVSEYSETLALCLLMFVANSLDPDQDPNLFDALMGKSRGGGGGGGGGHGV